MRRRASLILLVLMAAACGGDTEEQPSVSTEAPVIEASTTTSQASDQSTPSSTATSVAPAPPGAQACADVVAATVERSGSSYHFSATVRSGDTGWEKYADAWIVRTPDGLILGERVLAHPHEAEQPFTRSLSDIAIPEGTDEVEIAARDSVNGFCGEVFIVAVPS